MFTIIGGDGKEYGPVTADQVRAWMAAGRANLDTKAKAAGSEEWRRLGDFSEFGGVTGQPPVVMGTFTAAAPVTDANLAERASRLGAWFVDNVIAFVAAMPGILMLGTSVVRAMITGEQDPENIDPAKMVGGFAVLAVGLLTLAVVQIWMLSTRGQTIGKRLLNIRIVKFTDGSNPGFVGAVLMRAIVPGIIGAVPYIGWIFTLVDICFIFRDDRRCIHDLMAGTKVVRA